MPSEPSDRFEVPIDGDPRLAAERIAEEIDRRSGSWRIEPRLAGEVRFPRAFAYRKRGGRKTPGFGEFHGEFREVAGRWVLTGRFEIPAATRVLAVLCLMLCGTIGIVAAGSILSVGSPISIVAGFGFALGFGAFLFLLCQMGLAAYRAERELLREELRTIANDPGPRGR